MKRVPVQHIEKATERGARFRRRVAQERRGIAGAGQDRFRRALQVQFSTLMERAVDGKPSPVAAQEAAQSVPVPSDAVQEEVERFYVEAAVRFGEVGLAHLKGMARVYVTKQEEAFRRRAKEYLDEVGAEKVSQISETTRDDLVTLLQQTIEDGVGIDEAQRRITDQLPQLTSQRATTIARTEIIPASNRAVHAGAREAGIALDKEWITALDGRQRTSPPDEFDHGAADGQIVDMDSHFVVSGEEMRFPGDTSQGASAGNVINCRCASAPIPKDR